MAFKMNGFPAHEGTSMNKQTSDAGKNLLKVVPNEEAYNKLSDIDKIGFDKAAKKAGLPTKPTVAKQKVVKEGEGQDQDKIFDKNGKHIGNYVNGKKVMHSFTKQVKDIILPEGFEKVQKSHPRPVKHDFNPNKLQGNKKITASKSMAKQKDFLDATEQQQRIEGSRVDLKEKKYLSDLKMGKLKHKNRNRIIGGPGAS